MQPYEGLTNGDLLGVTRNEGPVRFGGDIVSGPSVDQLRARPFGRKLDSPNMFLWDGEPWVVARRSTAFGGPQSV